MTEKTCPNCSAPANVDPGSPPGFRSYECQKCAFVLIETIKEEAPPRPVGARWTRGEMLGYLRKPVDFGALKKRIETIGDYWVNHATLAK
jgi:hypothetical protein